MRILAADFGDARTGLAICDSAEILATPIGNVTEKSLNKMAAGTAAAALEREAGMIVIGLPINMDGTEGPRAAKCRKFAAAVENALGDNQIPIVLWDERSTTVQAHRNLLAADLHGKKQRERIDAEAAAIILDSYIRYRKNTAERQ